MALPQAGQGNNGAIHLSIQRGKGLAGDKKGKLEDAFQISWACKVSLHAFSIPASWGLLGLLEKRPAEASLLSST